MTRFRALALLMILALLSIGADCRIGQPMDTNSGYTFYGRYLSE